MGVLDVCGCTAAIDQSDRPLDSETRAYDGPSDGPVDRAVSRRLADSVGISSV